MNAALVQYFPSGVTNEGFGRIYFDDNLAQNADYIELNVYTTMGTRANQTTELHGENYVDFAIESDFDYLIIQRINVHITGNGDDTYFQSDIYISEFEKLDTTTSSNNSSPGWPHLRVRRLHN